MESSAGVATILFVEGESDRVFLDAYFHRELHVAGVAVIPIHGVVGANKKGLVDSEIVLRMTVARIAILVDHVRYAKANQLQSDPEYRHECVHMKGAQNPERRELARLTDRGIQLERELSR